MFRRSRSYSSWHSVGLSGKLNLRIPCLLSNAISKKKKNHFFAEDIWAAVHELCCRVSSEHLSTFIKSQEKILKLRVLSGQQLEAVTVYPFCPLPGSISLVEFLHLLMSMHLPAHPGRPTASLQVSWHLYESLQSFRPEITCPGCTAL